MSEISSTNLEAVGKRKIAASNRKNVTGRGKSKRKVTHGKKKVQQVK